MYAVDVAGFNYYQMTFEEICEKYSLDPIQKHLIKSWQMITIIDVITIHRIK